MGLIYLVQHAEKQPEPGDPPLTALGRRQATLTGTWLASRGIAAVHSSPLLRARETAQCVAAAAGDLPVVLDDRLRERMNWDGTVPFEDFLHDWSRTTIDRDFVPRAGDSSRATAERALGALRELATTPAPVAVVSHGGVTVDLLRTLVGDERVPPALLDRGVPACAVTILDGTAVVRIAGTTHLPGGPPSPGA